MKATAEKVVRKARSRDEALELVRQYKQIIRPRFDVELEVIMFGSYSKGYANPDSGIDAASLYRLMAIRSLTSQRNCGTVSIKLVFS